MAGFVLHGEPGHLGPAAPDKQFVTVTVQPEALVPLNVVSAEHGAAGRGRKDW